jgi:hypothetical protein
MAFRQESHAHVLPREDECQEIEFAMEDWIEFAV